MPAAPAAVGDDTTASVVDRNNRAHDVENLYIVDGSFFPSSGGVNPALTIAANALRVARHVTEATGSPGVEPNQDPLELVPTR